MTDTPRPDEHRLRQDLERAREELTALRRQQVDLEATNERLRGIVSNKEVRIEQEVYAVTRRWTNAIGRDSRDPLPTVGELEAITTELLADASRHAFKVEDIHGRLLRLTRHRDVLQQRCDRVAESVRLLQKELCVRTIERDSCADGCERLETRLAEMKKELDEANALAERRRRERYEALDARTTEGLSAAEWQARTGRAEAHAQRLAGMLRRLWPASLQPEDAEELSAALADTPETEHHGPGCESGACGPLCRVPRPAPTSDEAVDRIRRLTQQLNEADDVAERMRKSHAEDRDTWEKQRQSLADDVVEAEKRLVEVKLERDEARTAAVRQAGVAAAKIAENNELRRELDKARASMTVKAGDDPGAVVMHPDEYDRLCKAEAECKLMRTDDAELRELVRWAQHHVPRDVPQVSWFLDRAAAVLGRDAAHAGTATLAPRLYAAEPKNDETCDEPACPGCDRLSRRVEQLQEAMRECNCCRVLAASRSEEPDGDELASWVVQKWDDEVAHRPMENAFRRMLDNTWRQVYRRVTGQELPRPPHVAPDRHAGESGEIERIAKTFGPRRFLRSTAPICGASDGLFWHIDVKAARCRCGHEIPVSDDGTYVVPHHVDGVPTQDWKAKLERVAPAEPDAEKSAG